MTVLKLVPPTDPVLRRRTRGVSRVLPEHRRLIDDMIETVLQQGGIGLSANQVGSHHRIAVLHLPTWAGPMVYINPRLLARSGRYQVMEGCLSIPGYQGRVERFQNVTVRALGLAGYAFETETDGLLAHALQHEIDHLDGKLYIERLIA